MFIEKILCTRHCQMYCYHHVADEGKEAQRGEGNDLRTHKPVTDWQSRGSQGNRRAERVLEGMGRPI